jgi:ATP synthase protein I
MSDPPDKQGRIPGELTPEERARFEGRVSDLGGRLDQIKARQTAQEDADRDAVLRGRGMAYGMRMAAELVAAVIVGGIIGWALDWVFGSTPWFFLLFFVLGFAAGALNVMRAYEKMQREFTARTGGRIGQDIKDDDD